MTLPTMSCTPVEAASTPNAATTTHPAVVDVAVVEDARENNYMILFILGLALVFLLVLLILVYICKRCSRRSSSSFSAKRHEQKEKEYNQLMQAQETDV